MTQTRPNILFIMSDDHAAHAISAYGSRINQTPNIDRIANEGVLFENCFCTNSICEPSRAAILTGTYNHVNKVTTIGAHWDNRQEAVSKILQRNGYQTAIIGKWHLGQGPEHWPTGFDYWNILPGQGKYFDPDMVEMGEPRKYQGHTTNIITDLTLKWLDSRDRERPFFLMFHHKAPHRHWQPAPEEAHLFENEDIPVPETFDDDYSNRSRAAKEAKMRIDRDLNEQDTKGPVPPGLSEKEAKYWKYQRYIKDYLRCVAGIDRSVGTVLDYLDREGLSENTIVIYTSDQGFFLGDHNWYDKRFMYEESLRMPFIMRYPKELPAGRREEAFITNVDFAPTWLDYAGIEIPQSFQGYSFRNVARGEVPPDWQDAIYYRYWMHLSHHYVSAHYGIRTRDYKLIYYYGDACGQPNTVDEPKEPEWELFDLNKDPHEMCNVYHLPEYRQIREELKDRLHQLQRQVGDEPMPEIP